MGLLLTKLLRGVSYILTFINEFSRMTFGYLLEHKDQTFNRFKDFKALIENQSGFKITMMSIITINLMIFVPSMKSRGSLLSLTLLSWNGVAKRKNITIQEMVICMLGDLPSFL